MDPRGALESLFQSYPSKAYGKSAVAAAASLMGVPSNHRLNKITSSPFSMPSLCWLGKSNNHFRFQFSVVITDLRSAERVTIPRRCLSSYWAAWFSTYGFLLRPPYLWELAGSWLWPKIFESIEGCIMNWSRALPSWFPLMNNISAI